MTSKSEKLRSLFLAALMVFSVFAVTVSLSGGAAAALNSSTVTYSESNAEGDAALTSGGSFFAGQEVYVGGLEANADYQVRTVDTSGDNDQIGTRARALESDADGIVEFELDGRLSEGDFVLADESRNAISVNSSNGEATETTSNIEDAQFEVVPQDLTAEFDDDTADNAEDADTVKFDITSDIRNGYEANVSADGLDHDDLTNIFGSSNVSDTTSAGENVVDADKVVLNSAEAFEGNDGYDLNFSNIDEDTYTFEVNVTDTSANDSDTIEVADAGAETATINESLIQEDRGDVVEIPVQMESTDTATVEIGDYEDDNYNMTVEVEDDNNDGVVVIEFNTYSAGAVNATSYASDGSGTYSIDSNNLIGGVVNVKSDDDNLLTARENGSYSVNADSAAGFNSTGVRAEPKPVGSDVMDASEYDVRVEAGEHDYVSDEDDVATIELQERSTEGVQVWTLPEDKANEFSGEDNDERTELIYDLVANGNLTQSDTIAIDDVTDTGVVQVQASGLEGVFEYHASSVGGDLDRTQVYNAISSDGASNEYGVSKSTQFVAPFSTQFDDEDATANTDDEGINVGDDIGTGDYEVTYDAENDTHFIVFEDMGEIDALDADDGNSYAANFSMSDSDGDGLTDGSVTETDEFDTSDADGEVNDGQRVTVTANEGQTLDAETNVAPGTEVVIRARSTSQTAGAPFLKQPTGIVQPDGTVEATGDFSDADAGSNFTAQIRVGGTNVGDSVDGTVLNATAETPEDTETTPEEETEEPTEPMETEEPTEPMETEEPTEETTTGGSGPGFTAAIALIALIAAALLAVRRDN